MRRPLATTLALLALLCAAPSAEAKVEWVVEGRGFGHGVGMSQWGAYGYAKRGKGHAFILGHYYPGTRLERLERPATIRVLLSAARGAVRFRGALSACGVALDPRWRYSARRAGNSVRLHGPSGRRLADCGRRLRAPGSGGVLRIGSGRYRGALEVVPTRDDRLALNAVNAVDVDDYVKGVIASESPSSWPQAALRAQAVAARSYALSSSVEGNGFDVYSDTRSQVYAGIGGETAATNQAADATRGQVLRYGNEVAQTFFFACSGGHTESVENVFYGGRVPYLVGVPDPYDGECPLHRWRLRFSGAEIAARLGGYLRGGLKRIGAIRRGASPRIVSAKLYGTRGVTTIRGDRLAYALGAHDRWLSFRKLVNGRVVPGAGGGPARVPDPARDAPAPPQGATPPQSAPPSQGASPPPGPVGGISG